MVRESAAERKRVSGKEHKGFWWLIALCFLIIGVLAGLGFFGYQKFNTVLAEKEKEVVAAKKALGVCKAKPKIVCQAVVPKKKVHRRSTVKKTFVQQAKKIEEEKFDPKHCGEGTEAVISKATEKPECRAIHAANPMPAPVAMKVESPKPDMECKEPLIRQLRDDGSIACIAPPAAQPASQVVPGCLPPDSLGRIMCRRTEVKSSSSWIPWAVGGAAVLAIANNRHRGHGNSGPPPVVSSPTIITNNPQGPNVITLPPGPGVVTR